MGIVQKTLRAGGLAAAIVGMTFASGSASATSSTHAILASSKTNFSAAFERPTWNLSCDTSTKAWTFSINNVQVINSHGHPWLDSANGQRGPWHVTVFSGPPGGGAVHFSPVLVLKQNSTNGLFGAKSKGRDATIADWCSKGNGASVTAFSGSEQSLLLDGTFG